MDSVNNSVHRVMHRSAEHQRQNERLFSQLETMRDRLLGSPTGGAAGGGRSDVDSGLSTDGRTERTGWGQTGVAAGQTGRDVSATDDPMSRTLVI